MTGHDPARLGGATSARGLVVKSPEEIELMRIAGRLVAGALLEARAMTAPGVTTGALDRRVAEYVKDHGGRCSFKGYRGYPAHICASVNEEVVHGIPGKRELREGDILSVDVGVIWRGYHGDGARTFPVGEIPDEALRLLETTEDALRAGLAEARDGGRLTDISHAVEARVKRDGFSVVRDLVGHGIGREMHEDPQVPNYGPAGRGPRLRAGITLAVEPMVNAGGAAVETLADGWTVIARDHSLSAHFEHTVVITADGVEILTLPGPVTP